VHHATSSNPWRGQTPAGRHTPSLLAALDRLHRPHDSWSPLLQDAAQFVLKWSGMRYCALSWQAENAPPLEIFASCEHSPPAGWQERARQTIARHGAAKAEFISHGAGELFLPLRGAGGDHGCLYAFGCQRSTPTRDMRWQVLQYLLTTTLELHALRQRVAAKPVSNEPANSALVPHIHAAIANPERIAKIVARSFYRELRKAGFAPKQILMVANELIGNLSEALNKTQAKTDAASRRQLGTETQTQR